MKSIDQSADYFEPLLRGRIAKAMRLVKESVSINDLAMAMGNRRQAAALIPRKVIAEALKPAQKVVVDAFRQGGKIGALKVKQALRG